MKAERTAEKFKPHSNKIKQLVHEHLHSTTNALTGISHLEFQSLLETGVVPKSPWRDNMLSGFNLVIPKGNIEEVTNYVFESANWSAGLHTFYSLLGSNELQQVPSLQDDFYGCIGDLYTAVTNEIDITRYEGLQRLSVGLSEFHSISLQESNELVYRYLEESADVYKRNMGVVLGLKKGQVKYCFDHLNSRWEGYTDRAIPLTRIEEIILPNSDILYFNEAQ